ncbi:MAG TPA: DUF6265 family protein [Thermoanaerobaculia bacterium]|nr:DUF6265 family protein [Thermoanaerobaculia bacterium]
MRRLTPLILPALLTASMTLSAAELPGWMTGTWRATNGDAISEEIWSAADGTLMTGTNRVIATGKTTWFEFLRIENRDGNLIYVAMPGGRPGTEFAAEKVEPSRITFENPEHDFPQRIIYWRDGERLCARIEGGDGKGQEWCWSRFRD